MSRGLTVLLLTLLASNFFAASAFAFPVSDAVRGTIVVAVPVNNGLVVCADKRLFNAQSAAYSDDNTKIRRADKNALFVATNTIGFYDPNDQTMAFSAFDVTERFVATHKLSEGKQFWDGLKREINAALREYFAKRTFAEWPDSDRASNNLLFNLIFYVTDNGRAFSYTVRVFYEKAKTPRIFISDPVKEEIRTTKLAGKGKEVMQFIARTPAVSNDPMIIRFGDARLDAKTTAATDATAFARKLVRVTSSGVPESHVSPGSDCALLDYQTGFRWID